MAAYYALRLYQRTMHNRRPEGIASREISLADGAVLIPLVLCIVGLALYPQLILHRTDASVQRSVAAVKAGPKAKLAKLKVLQFEDVFPKSGSSGWTGYAPTRDR
jgi:NADH:ubiquinone oxidoreductase subunit 4 (subunit M)